MEQQLSQLLLTYFVLAIEIIIIHNLVKSDNKRIIYLYFFFFQFFLLAGFRSLEVHPDTLNYASHFNNVDGKGSIFQINADIFNPGYLIFEKFVYKLVSGSVLGYNLVTSFIVTFSTMLMFYKNARHMGVAIFLYYISGEYFGQIAVLRESMAVVVGYYYIHFLFQKNILYCILLFLLAFSLHNSSIILIFLLLLQLYNPGNKARIIIVITTFGVVYTIAPVMEAVLDAINFETKYFEEGVEKGFLTVNGIFNGVVGILIAYFVDKMLKNVNGVKRIPLYKNVVFLYFIISLVCLRLSILSRMLMFLNPIMFVIIADLLLVSSKNRRYAILAILVYAGNIIIKQVYRPEWIGIFPYSFYNDSQLNMLLY